MAQVTLDQIVAPVLQASKNNDVATLRQIMEIVPAAARAGNGIGQTGLHVAAIWGQCAAAQVLIDAGAEVDAQNQFGVTPLASAVPKDHLDMVQLLIDNGADPRLRASNGTTPIDLAKSDAMRAVLGGRPLKGHAAVTAADTAALEALLTGGDLDLAAQDSDGDTMLHLAVKAAVGDGTGTAPAASTMLDILLRHDSATGFVKAQRLHNDAGLTPLHIAASRATPRHAAASEALLRAARPDGLIDAATVQKGTLHNGQWGKKNAAGKIVRLSAAGSTALHLAVQDLQEKAEDADEAGEEAVLDAGLVRALLSHGADPNALDGDLQTPLHIAILGSLHEVVQLLCEARADLSLGCKPFGKDNTALHQAVILRDATMIKLLADNGADVDAPGRDGWTPLCMAVRSKALGAATALLEARANVRAVAGNGKTALEVADVNKSTPEMLELLQAAH